MYTTYCKACVNMPTLTSKRVAAAASVVGPVLTKKDRQILATAIGLATEQDAFSILISGAKHGVKACCSPFRAKPVTKHLFIDGRGNLRIYGGAGTRGAAAMFDLAARHTPHTMWSVPASQFHCGDEVPVPSALLRPPPTAHLSSPSGE